MPTQTPIARSKTAAMSRVLDSLSKGYDRYTSGLVAPEKALRMIRKLHEKHCIGATPAQRLTRKKQGKANAILVVYWPPESDSQQGAMVEWLTLFTAGVLDAQETLRDAAKKPRLNWLGYELVRYAARGKTSWTWRRPAEAMTELFLLLEQHIGERRHDRVHELMLRVARQPGFHGVREQSAKLFREAARKGYKGLYPDLLYVQKVNHGDRLLLT